MSARKYPKSTNPFDEDDDEIDDETFLRNSRRPPAANNSYYGNATAADSYDDQLQSLQERRKQVEDRTLNSTERSLSILRDSEQIGIATAEELLRQREKLEKTDRQLDEINATLRFSQKHINGIKSVFSSLKNYMSGRSQSPSPSSVSTPSTVKACEPQTRSELHSTVENQDHFRNHPTTRLRGLDYDAQKSPPSGGSKDFSARLDANLQEMCSNISVLKGLATGLSSEIDSQNDLIDTITDKTERADGTIGRQNKDMVRLLKK